MNEKKEQIKRDIRDIRDALFIDCPIRNVCACRRQMVAPCAVQPTAQGAYAF